jgi:hypothetical protein
MIYIAGTIPVEGAPLLHDRPILKNNALTLGDLEIPCAMGTAALVTSCLVTCDYLGLQRPYWVTAGDIGNGDGSRLIYNYLTEKVPENSPTILCLHYILPIISLMRNLVEAIERSKKRPLLIADAGAIYAAKSAGLAPEFDIFTPDAGELAFLADPKATHPAYAAPYLMRADTISTEIPKLIEQAHRYGNTAKILLVKNPIDYISKEGQIITTISEPNVPTLEPIGGTGDIIAGAIAGLIFAGYEPLVAVVIAAKTNRMAGKFAKPSPATKVGEIIAQYPEIYRQYLEEWRKELIELT